MQKGFTLIEVLVVIAVLAVIMSVGLVLDMSSYKRDTFYSEQSTLVSTLETARSHAMTNFCESAYGVRYVAPNYVIFRVNTTSSVCPSIPTTELISANTAVAATSTYVIFSQLSGFATATTTWMTNGVKSGYIIINNEGTIIW